MSVQPLPIVNESADTVLTDEIMSSLNARIAQARTRNCHWASFTMAHGTRVNRAVRIAVKKAFLDSGYDIDFYPGGDDFRGGGPGFTVDWSHR